MTPARIAVVKQSDRAREVARRQDGRFGEQVRAEPAPLEVPGSPYERLFATGQPQPNAAAIVAAYNNPDPSFADRLDAEFPGIDPSERDELARQLAHADLMADWFREHGEHAAYAADEWDYTHPDAPDLLLVAPSQCPAADEPGCDWEALAEANLNAYQTQQVSLVANRRLLGRAAAGAA